MTRKLVNIKNVLRIIISLFVIANMAKSCAKAYTFDDLTSFCNQIVNNQDITNNNVKLTANWYLNYKDNIIDWFNKYGEFDSYVLGYTGSYYSIWAYDGGVFSGWRYQNTTEIITGDTKHRLRLYKNGTWINNDGRNSTNYIFLFNETIASNVDFGNRIGNNYYSSFDMQFNHAFSSDYNYNGETIQAVQLNYNNSKVFIEDIAPTDNITSIKAYLDDFELEVIDLRYMGNDRKISKIK